MAKLAAKARQQAQENGDLDHRDGQGGDKSKVISQADISADAPIYNEEDIMGLKIIDTDGDASTPCLTHDVKNRNLAFALSSMDRPAFPMATGVLYDDPKPTYETEVASAGAELRRNGKTLKDIMHAGFTWTVDEPV